MFVERWPVWFMMARSGGADGRRAVRQSGAQGVAGVALGIQADRRGPAFDDAHHGFVRESPRQNPLELVHRPEAAPSTMRAVSSEPCRSAALRACEMTTRRRAAIAYSLAKATTEPSSGLTLEYREPPRLGRRRPGAREDPPECGEQRLQRSPVSPDGSPP
jgi:hypothetical protein